MPENCAAEQQQKYGLPCCYIVGTVRPNEKLSTDTHHELDTARNMFHVVTEICMRTRSRNGGLWACLNCLRLICNHATPGNVSDRDTAWTERCNLFLLTTMPKVRLSGSGDARTSVFQEIALIFIEVPLSVSYTTAFVVGGVSL